MKKSYKNSIKIEEVNKDIDNLLKYIEKIENLNYDEETDTLDEDTDVISKEVNELDKTIREKYKDYLDSPEKNNTK